MIGRSLFYVYIIDIIHDKKTSSCFALSIKIKGKYLLGAHINFDLVAT